MKICEMQSKYYQVNLQNMLEELGKDRVETILSDFSCPQNEDVEYFLKRKAILFSQQGFAKTFLVFWCSADETERYLIGYYSIASKVIEVERNSVSKRTYSKLLQFDVTSFTEEGCMVPAILIGQLGKKFTDGNNTLISGDELLKMAVDRIHDIQYELGGKFTYVECENKEKLIRFYQNNGFVLFGKRKLDKDETMIQGKELMQLLKYIHT